MSSISDITSFVFIAQTTILVIATVLLAYPVVAYARNVVYTRGLLLLSGSFLILTFTYVVSFVFHLPVVSGALDLASATLAAFGVWQLARPFIRFDGGDIETTTVSETSGGFESAGDD
jgi:uncharacterized membrane protein YgdD (TMEM256/DUF423 family)